MGLSLPEAGITQAAFPSTFLMCAAGTLSLSTLHKSFDWAGNQKNPLLSFHKRIQTPNEGQILLNLCPACPQQIDLSGSRGGVRHHSTGASSLSVTLTAGHLGIGS